MKKAVPVSARARTKGRGAWYRSGSRLSALFLFGRPLRLGFGLGSLGSLLGVLGLLALVAKTLKLVLLGLVRHLATPVSKE